MQPAFLTEQIRILYDNIPLSLIGSGSVALTFSAVMLPIAELQPIVIWLSLVFALIVWRTTQFLTFKRRERLDNIDASYAQQCGLQTVIFSGIFGLTFAWLPYYYVAPNEVLPLTNVALFLVGMVAGAMVTQAVYMPSLFAFLIPIGTSSTLAVALKSGDLSYLALASAGYTGIAIYFCLRINKTFIESIKMRFENEDLVQALRTQMHTAEEANRAKSQFLASASHDVRQPLHAMGLYMGMLKNDPGNIEIINRLHGALASLEDLYSRILEVSQLDSGTTRVQIQSVNLTELCTQLVDRNQSIAANKHLDLRHSIPPKTWVLTDDVLLARMLDNLLSNALRYTEKGSVSVESQQIGDRLVLTVRDTGLGIDTEQLDLIFTEFYQVDNSARDRSKGIGLGLSIVKRLADLLDHSLNVESEPGRGSVFSLELKLAEEQPAPVPAEHLVQQELNANVLVIEDDVQVAEAITMQLIQWGCNVELDSAAATLDQLPFVPDIIIADYRLPGSHNGVSAIEYIRAQSAQHARIPAIITTGDTAPHLFNEIDKTITRVAHKPVAPDALMSLVREMLDAQIPAEAVSTIPRA